MGWQEKALKLWETDIPMSKIRAELKIGIRKLEKFYREKFTDQAYLDRAAKMKRIHQHKKGYKMPEDNDPKTCPICGKKCQNARGFASHFSLLKKSGDKKHIQYWEELKLKETQEKRSKASQNRAEAAKKGHQKRREESYKETKKVLCPECGENEIEVSVYVSPELLKKIKCDACLKEQSQMEHFGKEGINYIKCCLCDYITKENLTKHLKDVHDLTGTKYKEKYEKEVTSQKFKEGCSERTKGRKHTPNAKLKMSEIKREKDKNLSWEEKAEFGKKVSEGKKGKSINFPLRYGFTEEELLQFSDKNGKVLVPLAAEKLQTTDLTIRRYCNRQDLETKKGRTFQESVLQMISDELEGFPIKVEATFDILRDVETKRPYIYDGYLPEPFNLLIEIDGIQHDELTPHFHRTDDAFEKQKLRDARKRKIAIKNEFRFIRFKHDDDLTPRFIHQKLRQVFKVEPSVLIKEAEEYHSDFEIPEGLKESSKAFCYIQSLLTWVWERKGFPFIEQGSLEDFEKLQLKKFDEMPTGNIALTLTNSYMPHMWAIPTENISGVEYFEKNLPKLIRNRLKYAERSVRASTIRTGVSLRVNPPKNFKPSIAKYLIEKYGGKKCSVFDPCCGFGGRLVGAFAAKNCYSYIGTEPEKRTYAGLLKIRDDLYSLGKDFSINIQNLPIEDFNENIKVDLILTSPPYFDKEKYSEELTQSHIKNSRYDKWKENFLRPLANRINSSLKDNGYAIIMLNDYKIYPIKTDFIKIMENLGFKLEETLDYKTSHTYKDKHIEPLLVFKKEKSSQNVGNLEEEDLI